MSEFENIEREEETDGLWEEYYLNNKCPLCDYPVEIDNQICGTCQIVTENLF